MAALLLKAVGLCCLLHTLFAIPSKHEDIRSLLETMQSTHDNKIAKLTQRIEENEKECDRKVVSLEKRILHLEAENKKLNDENSNNKKEILSLLKSVANVWNTVVNRKDHVTNVRQDEKPVTVPTKEHAVGMIVDKEVEIKKYQPKYDNRIDRALDYSLNIAFTAYLDHDLEHQGQGQTLIYNRVLLNDGNGYNNNTGVFTVPVTGVYSLTFYLGQRDPNEVHAYLVVNNQHKVDVAVESLHVHQDLQGGNTANLRLSKGDSVYITHQGGGTHIEGDDGLRTTTFSGFLIYPIETLNVVGK